MALILKNSNSKWPLSAILNDKKAKPSAMRHPMDFAFTYHKLYFKAIKCLLTDGARLGKTSH